MLLALVLALVLAWVSAEESYDLNEFGVPLWRFDLIPEVVLPAGAVHVDAALCMLAVTGLNLPSGSSSCLFFEAPGEAALAADVIERFRAAGYEVGAARPVIEGVIGYRLTAATWAHSLLLVMNANSPGYLSVTIVLQPELR